MEWIRKTDVLIVGLGLIGGSYAKALRRLGYHITAIDSDPEAIRYAVEHGVIDEGWDHVEESAVTAADVVIFALYPHVFVEWIAAHWHLFKPGCHITDVTGVKSAVVYQIQDMLPDNVEFIAAHPMAGREVGGVQNSTDRIFRDANYLVVPTEKNTEGAIEWCMNLGRILGFARITVLTPQEHDEMIAFVSQLTHLMSVALMTCTDSPDIFACTGDSFRDLTRIARINDAMWSELFLLNKDALLRQTDAFLNELTELRNMIANDDREGLRRKMRLSAARRSAFDESRPL